MIQKSEIKRDRENKLEQIEGEIFDLLVIGGGINGLGIARDARMRGLKVSLVEKGDFAAGTSSKSAKLIHGGIRYFETLQFKMVLESVRERNILKKIAPHIIHPLRFVFPIYKEDRIPKLFLYIGLFLYDLFSGFKKPRHERFSKDEILELIPWLKKKGLKGGGAFIDAVSDDSRLCIENAIAAENNGATILNYAEVKIINTENAIKEITVKDKILNKEFIIKTKTIASVVGIWTNELWDEKFNLPDITASLGIHIMLSQKFAEDAIGFFYQNRKSGGFIVPWGKYALVGTTDNVYKGDPDNINPPKEDIDFLLAETKRICEEEDLFSRDKVYSAFAGARPLVSAKTIVTDIPRDFRFFVPEQGILIVVGGKITTYRLLAEKAVNKVSKWIKKGSKCQTDKINLPGSKSQDYETFRTNMLDMLIKMQFKVTTAQHLLKTYGTRVEDIIDLIKKDTTLREQISSELPIIKAEIPYLIENEYVFTLQDIFIRRLHLDLVPSHGEPLIEYVKQQLINHPKFSRYDKKQRKNDVIKQVEDYYNYIKRNTKYII